MSQDPSNQPDEGEELAHYDDSVIGKAFKGSFVALLLLGVLSGGGFYLARRKPAAGPAKVTQLSAPAQQQATVAPIPEAKFADITDAAGIRFVHNSGATGEKLLPETMGGAAAFLDFDGDGFQDILFVNGAWWPGHTPEGKTPTTPALYRNDGKGNFTDVTAGSGLDTSFYGMGIAVGDYDNDGLSDVFISGVGGCRLFKNLGKGKFQDVTASAGVGGNGKDWSSACAFVDYDNDGKLDLFVGNYVKWSREIDQEVGYKLVGVGRAYGQPMNFEGAFPVLYHNEGNGRFADVSAKSGVQVKNPSTGVPTAKTLGVAPVDLDGDGWIDLVVANDTVQNFVFHNQKDGTFKEIGALAGVAFDSYGATRGAMGIDTAKFRNDSAWGIAIGNFANEMTALYVSQGSPMVFADEAITEGIGPASRLLLKFGIFFFDYDLDGRLDVLTANGHLEEEINKVQQSQHYAQPAQLFWNCGPAKAGCFATVSPEKAGTDLFKPMVGRGSAYADIDGDGDPDVLLMQTSGKPMLLRNEQRLGHHWLRVKLVGMKANRDAIGAIVRAKVGGLILERQVMPTRSYLSCSELPVTFGLGSEKNVEELTILWPGGGEQKVPAPPIDQTLVLREN